MRKNSASEGAWSFGGAPGVEMAGIRASVVWNVSGKTQVLDGPYADTKEQLGCFHIIEVNDLDAAISWAARSPTALHGVG